MIHKFHRVIFLGEKFWGGGERKGGKFELPWPVVQWWPGMRMMRIVDGIHVRSRAMLSMVSRVRPRPGCCSSVKLMMLLARRYAWNLHRGYSVYVVGRQNAATSCRGPLRRILHPRNNGDRLALVRLAIPKTFRERVARDLELRDAMILIRGDGCESCLRERERFEILGPWIGGRAGRRRCYHDVATWLISMHRIQDYLQKQSMNRIYYNCYIRFPLLQEIVMRAWLWRCVMIMKKKKERERRKGEEEKKRRERKKRGEKKRHTREDLPSPREEGLPQGGGHNVWQPQETRWLISVKTNLLLPPIFFSNPTPSSFLLHTLTAAYARACVSLNTRKKECWEGRGRQKERKKSHPHNAYGVCGLTSKISLDDCDFSSFFFCSFFLFFLFFFSTFYSLTSFDHTFLLKYIYIFFFLVKKFKAITFK